MSKKQTIKEYIGKDGVKEVNKRLKEFWEDTDGFLFIGTANNPPKITDVYKGICKKCVLEEIKSAVEDADSLGLLAENTENENHHDIVPADEN